MKVKASPQPKKQENVKTPNKKAKKTADESMVEEKSAVSPAKKAKVVQENPKNNTPVKGNKGGKLQKKNSKIAEEEEQKVEQPTKQAANGKNVAKKGNQKVEKEVQVKQPAKKAMNGKGNANAKKIVKQPEVEEEDDEDEEEAEEEEEEDEEEGSENDNNVTVQHMMDEEAEEDDEEEEDEEDEEEESDEEVDVENGTSKGDNDDEEDEDDNDDEDEDESGDEQPAEVPVQKQEEAKKTNTKFVTTEPEKSIPEERKLYVKEPGKELRLFGIFNAFKMYGCVTHIYHDKENSEVCVVFSVPDEAVVALLHERTLNPTSKVFKADDMTDKTVLVKNFKFSTTIDEIKAHMKDAGKIQYASYIPKVKGTGRNALIVYADEASAKNALKKHNSILDERNILVTAKDQSIRNIIDDKRTLIVVNNKNYISFDVAKLEKVFKDCGEIEYIEIICSKSFLASITFKDEESCKKAMELNGKTFDDFVVNLQSKLAIVGPRKTTIFVSGYGPWTKEEQIRTVFESIGPLKNVVFAKNFSIIEYENHDDYLKSFTIDEALLSGKKLYVEPYAPDKRKRASDDNKPNFNAKFNNNNRKRPFDGPKPNWENKKGKFDGPKKFENKGGKFEGKSKWENKNGNFKGNQNQGKPFGQKFNQKRNGPQNGNPFPKKQFKPKQNADA